MFFQALFLLAAVLVVGTFSITCVWFLIYYCSFLLPDWLGGIVSVGITWVRHQKPPQLALVALVASIIIDALIWRFLWLWTFSIGGAGVICLWLFSDH